MPRQARLDAPETLHVIVKGIGKRRIVDEDSFRRFGCPESRKISRAVGTMSLLPHVKLLFSK
jgi:hypothetical protein